jgi:hypothetical protein
MEDLRSAIVCVVTCILYVLCRQKVVRRHSPLRLTTVLARRSSLSVLYYVPTSDQRTIRTGEGLPSGHRGRLSLSRPTRRSKTKKVIFVLYYHRLIEVSCRDGPYHYIERLKGHLLQPPSRCRMTVITRVAWNPIGLRIPASSAAFRLCDRRSVAVLGLQRLTGISKPAATHTLSDHPPDRNTLLSRSFTTRRRTT